MGVGRVANFYRAAQRRDERAQRAEIRERTAPTAPDLGGFRECEGHCSARRALQSAVHRARVSHEVDPGPGVGGEELRRELIALQMITAAARENDIAMAVRAAMRERVDVVERRRVEVQCRAAIHASAPAIAHGRALDRALVTGSAQQTDAGVPTTRQAGEAGEHDAVTVSTNGHFTSRKKATPRDGKRSRGGVSWSPALSATLMARLMARRDRNKTDRRCRSSVHASDGEVAFAV